MREFQRDMPDLRKYLLDSGSLIWLILESAAENEMKILTDIFNFHKLTVDDCMTESHHPKIDDYGNYLFTVLHEVDYNIQEEKIDTIELTYIWGKIYS